MATIKEIAQVERRSKAIALRLAGVDYDSIAKQLGYSSRGAAYNEIENALAKQVEANSRVLEELREIELMRLDRLQAAAWRQALDGDFRAIEVCLKLIDRRCKLLGLDAPERVEVITVDWLDAAIRDVQAKIDARSTAIATCALEAAPE